MASSRFPGDPSKGMGIHPRPSSGGGSNHPPRDGNKQLGRNCMVGIPVAVAMLPWALVRLAWDTRKGRRII